MSKELIIIRHARSCHNTGETDDLDCGITKFGEHQAKNVGVFLNNEVPNLAYWSFFTSPFLRCLQTTEIICEQMPKFPQVTVSSDLREYLNHSGDEVHVPKRADFSDHIFWDNYPDTGWTFYKEQNEELLERSHRVYESFPDRSVIISHGLPVFALMHVAEHNAHYVPVWDNSIDNCSITWIKNSRIVWRGRNLHHEKGFDFIS